MSAVILIVEDELILGRNIRTFLERNGYQPTHVTTVRQALEQYHALQPDIVLVDHNLPDGTGLSLIQSIRGDDRWTKLVMMTAHGGVDLAVMAMKAGADDYLTKPVALEEVSILCGKLLEQARMRGSLAYFRDRDARRGGLSALIGESQPILEVKRRIKFLTNAEKSAGTGATAGGPPVLILGETGTGKELVARALHLEGPRAAQPFVAVNCATLPEQLIEAELFGHERGAFTGATEKRVGLFQAAEGGTLFLDEVGELPLAQQAKLLRALEEQSIRSVGSVRDRKINVRFVAATNAAIEDKARHGEFRADLLYRLNTITLDVPPLRERGRDILLIAEAMMAQFTRQYGRAGLILGEDARRALTQYSWPGNIRELRNVIEQACLMSARDEITPADLHLRQDAPRPERATTSTGAGEPIPGRGLIDTEKTLIIQSLRKNAGNISLAARDLGISRDTMRYRMEKFALKREHYS